jgi:hypothetical protein
MKGCGDGKDVYPDLTCALLARDAKIWRFGIDLYVVRCYDGSCKLWHLTRKRPYGTKDRRWNNIGTQVQRDQFDAMCALAARLYEHRWVV